MSQIVVKITLTTRPRQVNLDALPYCSISCTHFATTYRTALARPRRRDWPNTGSWYLRAGTDGVPRRPKARPPFGIVHARTNPHGQA